MDFTDISDDQLLQLLKLAMAEALNRGGAVRVAAEQEVVSAQERAEIERKVAARLLLEKEEIERKRIKEQAEARFRAEENKKQAKATETTWAQKAAITHAIKEWGYEGKFELNIWSSGADRRVYFQLDRQGTWKWCLYLTGNAYHPPMDFEGEGAKCWFDDKQKELKALLGLIAKHWKNDLKMTSDVGDVEPAAHKLQQYREVLFLRKVCVADAPPQSFSREEVAANV